jgi:hypothetical protein
MLHLLRVLIVVWVLTLLIAQVMDAPAARSRSEAAVFVRASHQSQ